MMRNLPAQPENENKMLQVSPLMVLRYVKPHQAGVPQSDDATQWNLAHEQIVHPAEGKLEVLNAVVSEMCVKRC